jgi:hypothetical protein
MQAAFQKLVKPCLECNGLRDGTRPNQESHEYLLAAWRGSPDSRLSSYRCLLCDSVLTKEHGELGTRWI